MKNRTVSPIFEFKDKEKKRKRILISLFLFLLLVFLLTYRAFASTEEVMVDPLVAGAVAAGAKESVERTDCKVVYNMPKLLGIIPRSVEVTCTVHADLKKYSVDDITEITKILNSSEIELEPPAEIKGKAFGVKVSCPLRDGEIEVAVRKTKSDNNNALKLP